MEAGRQPSTRASGAFSYTPHGLVSPVFQELGINITREVFQAWLKDPEFVPQLGGCLPGEFFLVG